jgi:Protein of unknown function (DUF1566)
MTGCLAMARAALGTAAVMLPVLCGAQPCELTGWPAGTPAPTPRYQDNGDGTVSDRRAALTWMRCAVGQTWAQARCTGTATRMTRNEASREMETFNRSGRQFHDDWRVPSLTELAYIAANGLFPDTPADFFWTSTARRTGGIDLEYYALSFGADGIKSSDADATHHLRLVRTGL